MAAKPVGHILDVARRRAHGIVQVALVDRTAVVSPEGLVVVSILLVQLLQTITILGSLGAVPDHLEDASGRVGGIEGNAVVALHQARVVDAVVGRLDPWVAARFLDDGAQDGTNVDARLLCDGLDGGVDVLDLLVARVVLHELGVLRPEHRVLGPLALRWELGCWAAVLDVAATTVGTAGGSWNAAANGLLSGRSIAASVAAGAGQLDDLADLEGLRLDAGVGSLDGLDGGVVLLGDLIEGIALLDGVVGHCE